MSATKNTRFGLKEIFAIVFTLLFVGALFIIMYAVKIKIGEVVFDFGTIVNITEGSDKMTWWQTVGYWTGIAGFITVTVFVIFEGLGLIFSLFFKKNEFVKLMLKFATSFATITFMLLLAFAISLILGALLRDNKPPVSAITKLVILDAIFILVPYFLITGVNHAMIRAKKLED